GTGPGAPASRGSRLSPAGLRRRRRDRLARAGGPRGVGPDRHPRGPPLVLLRLIPRRLVLRRLRRPVPSASSGGRPRRAPTRMLSARLHDSSEDSRPVTSRIDRILAWMMLSAQSLIILTVAIPRLTGSGLGCPTWPRCTAESTTPHGELTMHAAIEFGNRLLGVSLGVLGVVTILVLLRRFRTRPDLVWFAVGLTAIVPVQAVLGGITVLTGLNPWVVAGHFVPSAVAVVVSVLFVRRTYDSGGPARPVGTRAARSLTWTAFVLTWI